MTVEEWREGIGFDLTALERVTDPERDSLVTLLSDRLETLGAIGTDTRPLQHPELEVSITL